MCLRNSRTGVLYVVGKLLQVCESVVFHLTARKHNSYTFKMTIPVAVATNRIKSRLGSLRLSSRAISLISGCCALALPAAAQSGCPANADAASWYYAYVCSPNPCGSTEVFVFSFLGLALLWAGGRVWSARRKAASNLTAPAEAACGTE